MGMFDYVKYETKCPECGNEITEFQSKDNVCELKTLDYWQVDNFYTSCDKCNVWIEYSLKPEMRQNLPIDAYELSFHKMENPNE